VGRNVAGSVSRLPCYFGSGGGDLTAMEAISAKAQYRTQWIEQPKYFWWLIFLILVELYCCVEVQKAYIRRGVKRGSLGVLSVMLWVVVMLVVVGMWWFRNLGDGVWVCIRVGMVDSPMGYARNALGHVVFKS